MIVRLRIGYSVQDSLRFISHLDLMRMFFRACIRKNIPVEVSQGFSPHLKLSFGPPLSVGMSSKYELVDFYLKKPVSIDELKNDLSETTPEGIVIKDICEISDNMPALNAVIYKTLYSIEMPVNFLSDIKERINVLLKKDSAFIERHKKNKDPRKCKKKTVNVRPLIDKIEYNGSDKRLILTLLTKDMGNVRPLEILQLLYPEIETDELKLWKIQRENQEYCDL